ASGQAAGDLLPQQRGNHVPHDPVEEAPRLLGVDPVDIQLAGLGEGLLDGLLGNLVEHHAAIAAVIAADGLTQVPGDCLPLAVQVRCQIDGVGIPGQPTQLVDDLFLARQNLVAGLPAIFRIDTHPVDQLLPGAGCLVDVGSCGPGATLGFAL